MIRKPERLEVEPWVPVSDYTDSFGNRCRCLVVPSGRAGFRNDAIVEDTGRHDPQTWDALPHNVQDLPDDVLLFLLASRYCEVDSDLKDLASTLFDPRNNVPRIGRVLMARGRDAADAALTTTFGPHQLESFKVWTDDVSDAMLR